MAGRDIETWTELEWSSYAPRKDQDQHDMTWTDRDRLLDSSEFKTEDQVLGTTVLEKQEPPASLGLETHLEEQGHHYLLVLEQPGGCLVRGNMARQMVVRRLEGMEEGSRELGEFIDTTVEAFLGSGHSWFLMLEEEGETGVRGNLTPVQVLAILDKEAGKNPLKKYLEAARMVPSNVGQDNDSFENGDFADIEAYPGPASDQEDVKGENFVGNNVEKIPQLDLTNWKTIQTKSQCNEPGCTFISYKGLDQVSEHFGRIHVLVPCEHCGKVLQKKKIQKHVRRKHIKGNYKCDKCDVIYTTRCSLRDHKASVHDPTRHVCDHCGKDYANKFILQQHVRNVHYGGPPQICDKCDYQVLGPKEGMKVHKLVMHAATVLEVKFELSSPTDTTYSYITSYVHAHVVLPTASTLCRC